MENILINKPINDTQHDILAFLKTKGFKVFSIIDQRAEAINAGLNIPETRLIIFGNPKIGTLLMQENNDITFELPSKVLLIASKNQTKMIYKDPYNFSGVNELAAQGKTIIKNMHNMYLNMIQCVK